MLGALKFDSVMKRVFGSSNDRRLKGYRPQVAAINALEPEFEALTDDQLRAKTEELRAELKTIFAGRTVAECSLTVLAHDRHLEAVEETAWAATELASWAARRSRSGTTLSSAPR